VEKQLEREKSATEVDGINWCENENTSLALRPKEISTQEWKR